MKNQLFPKEIIENSQQANFAKHSLKSKVIYSTIVVFLIGILFLLPFTDVDVGVRSTGVVRPITELVQIRAPVSGKIQVLNAMDNSTIRRGDIFATIESPELSERLRFNEERQQEISIYLDDLDALQRVDSLTINITLELKSPRYRQAWLEFRQKLLNQRQEINQLDRQLERKTILFDKDAISQSALEETQYSRDAAVNRYKLLLGQQQNKWKEEEITFQNELDQLGSEHIQLSEELSRTEIRSPITGTVQNSDGILQNSFAYANQVMGEISPDTSLVAEAYVSPKDIGLLQPGMPVRMQIDAYNQNQWGVLTGRIKTISKDVMMNEDQPLFKVRCTLDQTFLELKNGFRGDVKKGMTFQARFIVSRRSLFQLLYDNMDDWLNPSWGGNEQMSQKGS
ncbi:HlyD family secretion protein [Rhodohalobacter sulfatireducens]|uniref:HlyD family secretion protein n=1 Tax=Rhodohalobacter sulfatireducens TaxID=2911366 RepID=A0ABS9KC27_9BACT|nr:HlyD family secretion protein [Rhodohalobacter sulfatireducens]MCG2588368.1 HlyD family secretion protein [Rhodohalobacter sulfatireducens]